MKEVDFIIQHERLNEVNAILHKHKVGGMFYSEISGRGKGERKEVEEIAHGGYRTGKRYVPEFHSLIKIQVIIPDALENALVGEIMNTISTGSAGDGKIFVKDVTNAYDIGSKTSGEKAAL